MHSCALSDETLSCLLAEDVPFGDLTTESLGLPGQPGRLEFRARGPMTVCGVEEAVRLFELAGASAREIVSSGAVAEDGSAAADCGRPGGCFTPGLENGADPDGMGQRNRQWSSRYGSRRRTGSGRLHP